MANHRKQELSPKALLLGLLALVAAAGLLLLLLFSSRLRSRTPETEPTLPPPPANPYQASDFYVEGGFVRCSAVPVKTGIDVSSHQGEINWDAVKEAGVEYAMIRVGFRGYDEGGVHEDSFAQANLKGATEAGLPVGVYFYSQATTVEEAQEEAAFVLDCIEGWEITYPVVFDWEWVDDEARTGDTSSRMVTDCTLAFCGAVEAAGYKPAFYFNQDLAKTTFRLRELTDYDFWLAQYQEAMTFAYDVAMWQYTCTGTVPGITGDVDVNLCFRNYA